MADTGRTVFADGLWADGFWAAGLWAADEALTVPDVDDPGTSQAAAVAAIEAVVGLIAAVVTAYSSTVPAGEVINQSPAAGTSVPPGTTVTITVSLGEAPQQTSSSGGWWAWWDEPERRRKARKRQEEREAELEEIQQQTDREIAALLRKQEAEDERRAELARLQTLVDRYQAERQSLELPERLAKAMQKAFESRTPLALEGLYQSVQMLMEEEEAAVIALLLTDDDD